MPTIKKKRAPSVDSNQRAWTQVYDDMNDVINSVNQKSAVESRNGASGLDGDIRLFKDVDKTKYFIEGKFSDGWAKRELLFSDLSNETQDESINFSATESYVKPDGTVPFTAKQSGIAPTNAAHLSTKGYTDVGRLISVTKSTNDLVFGMTDTASNITFTGFGSNAYNSTTIPTTFVSSLTDSQTATGVTLVSESTGELFRLGAGQNITITNTNPPEPNDAENWVEIACSINTANFLTQTVPRASGIRTFDTDAYTDTQTYGSGAYIVLDHDNSNVEATFSTITLADNSTAPSVRLNASGFLASNHAASGVTNTRITNWDNAYGWGNHASEYYLKTLEDTAATPGSGGQHGNLPTGHVCLIEDDGTDATAAKIYNIKSKNSNLVISDSATAGSDFIEFDVIDQTTSINRFHAIYTEDTENLTTSTGTAGGADAIVFQDTETTTWTAAAPVNDKVEVSLVVDHPADTNTTYSVSIPTSTTKLRLTAGGSGSGTDDIEFAGSGATSVTRTTADKFTISSTDTNTTTVTSTLATSEASTPHVYSLMDTADQIFALEEGSGINIEESATGGGDTIKISSTVDTSGLLTNGLYLVEAYQNDAVTTTATASGADKLRLIETDDIEWVISGPTLDVITITPTINFPADTHRAIHDTPVNGATTTSISSNWAFDNVKTAVPSGAAFTDWTTDQGSTNIHSGNYTDTNTTDITSTNATTTTGTNDFYTLLEDSDTIRALREGSGINIEIDGGASGGDAIKISSTVDTSGLLTNGIYLIEAYQDDAVTTTATASGADKLRFIETDDIEWVISGPSSDVITITPTINFPADTNTWRTVTAGGNTLGGGETLAFTAGTNVSITESAGAVTINSSYTNTTYSAGALLDLATTTFNVDLSELTDMTQTWVNGSDEFVVLDNGTQKRKLSSEIFGSNAFNSTSFLTGISSTGTTDESGTPPRVSLLDDSSTICVLEEGAGISIEESAIGGVGNTVKISSTVSTSGLLTNGIYLVEIFQDSVQTSVATASGADKLRIISTDDIEWAVSGPSTDVITLTPTINFPADNNTTYSAGSLLDLATTTFNVDLSEATDMTEAWVTGSDEFIVLDSGVQKRKLSSEIFGSNAFNSTSIPTGNAIIDWTADQGSTNIHSGNYTNTVYPGITSTNATTSSGHPDVYTLVEDSDTVRALKEGDGITMEVDDSGSGGDVIKINSTVSAGLTNGIVTVQDWNGSEVEDTVNASGGDTLRFVEASNVEWAVEINGDIISVTPSLDLSGYASSSHNHAASTITSGTLADARLPSDCGANTSYAASSHDHDSRYYTESEIDTSLALKANLSHADFSSISLNSHSFPAATGSSGNSWPGLIVGGTTRLVASGADLQVKSFIRICQHLIMHEDDSTNVLNQVGLTYANDNLTVWQASGSGQDNFHVPGDVIAYKSSDPRLKTNKEELESPLYKLSKIKGYRFDWLPEAKKYNSYNEGTDIGVMSNEVEQMYPELVQTRSSGYKAVDYEKLTAVLIAAVNDLTSKLIEKGVLDEELQSSKSCC